MKSFITSVIYFSLILLLVLGAVIFAFWRFGIFKQEPKLSEEFLKIKEQTDYIQNYSFQEANNYLSKLTAGIIQVPEVSSSELGRTNLFGNPIIQPTSSQKTIESATRTTTIKKR